MPEEHQTPGHWEDQNSISFSTFFTLYLLFSDESLNSGNSSNYVLGLENWNWVSV